ncbi:MAG: SMP-30/gluconolactonase/LRE family protein [Acutalibacteraceae bacterium]|nr:SMP-30/gluconolactonase/LRE family protein [Acutalibacteraceae bacterium]
MNIEVITDALTIVGEGPVWDDRRNKLYMTDILGKRFRTVDLKTGCIEDKIMPQQIGFIFLGENNEIYCGAQNGIYEITDGKFQPVCVPDKLKGNRFNDGKVGPDGRVYGGTISYDFSSAFYRLDSDYQLTELFDKVGNSNGLDWDEEKGLLYYTDTHTYKTDCFDFDGKGNLLNRRTVFEYSEGSPDGMCIDENGNLWTALWGVGKVICINPQTKKIIEEIVVPAAQPSCCTFAGENLDTLVITTAAHGRIIREENLSGALFAANVGVKGKKVNRFIKE